MYAPYGPFFAIIPEILPDNVPAKCSLWSTVLVLSALFWGAGWSAFFRVTPAVRARDTC